jgi:hypothetical protein
MPRLVGRQSNGGASVILLLLIAIGAATALEYEGVINVVPNFGKDYVGDKTPAGLPRFSFDNGTPDNTGTSGAANAPANQPASSQPSPSSSSVQ